MTKPKLIPTKRRGALIPFKGVRRTASGKYSAVIIVKETGKQKSLGTYESAREAARILSDYWAAREAALAGMEPT